VRPFSRRTTRHTEGAVGFLFGLRWRAEQALDWQGRQGTHTRVSTAGHILLHQATPAYTGSSQ